MLPHFNLIMSTCVHKNTATGQFSHLKFDPIKLDSKTGKTKECRLLPFCEVVRKINIFSNESAYNTNFSHHQNVE